MDALLTLPEIKAEARRLRAKVVAMVIFANDRIALVEAGLATHQRGRQGCPCDRHRHRAGGSAKPVLCLCRNGCLRGWKARSGRRLRP